MGGQACVLYGAAEFSRDIDFAVPPDEMHPLRKALQDLQAELVFFPPLSEEALRRGHACHFRCRAPGLHGFRIDVMGVMRGAEPFPRLWSRRREVRLPGVGRIALVSLPDLVSIKKTQRDKDWPMVRRLVESDIAAVRGKVTPSRIDFWLRECRTPSLLTNLGRRFSSAARHVAGERAAVRAALSGAVRSIERELEAEEKRERELDRRYWAPLRAELEQWRLHRR